MDSSISVDADGWWSKDTSVISEMTPTLATTDSTNSDTQIQERAAPREEIVALAEEIEKVELDLKETKETKVEMEDSDAGATLKETENVINEELVGAESLRCLSANIENSNPSTSAAQNESQSVIANSPTTIPPLSNGASPIRSPRPPSSSNPNSTKRSTPRARTSLTSRYAPKEPTTPSSSGRLPLASQEDAFRLSPSSSSNAVRGTGQWPTSESRQSTPLTGSSMADRRVSPTQVKSIPPQISPRSLTTGGPATPSKVASSTSTTTRPRNSSNGLSSSRWATKETSTAEPESNDASNISLWVEDEIPVKALTAPQPRKKSSGGGDSSKGSTSRYAPTPAVPELTDHSNISLWVEEETLGNTEPTSRLSRPSRNQNLNGAVKESIGYAAKVLKVPITSAPPVPVASSSSRTSQNISIPTTNFPAEAAVSSVRREMPNRNRIATGGVKQDKLSSADLDEKIRQMKLKNEAIEARAIAVERERVIEEALAKSEEAALAELRERERDEDAKRVDRIEKEREEKRLEALEKRTRTDALQARINEERRLTAEKKLSRVEGREWDSEKLKPASTLTDALYPSQQSIPVNTPRMGELEKGQERTAGGYDQVIQDEDPVKVAQTEPLW